MKPRTLHQIKFVDVGGGFLPRTGTPITERESSATDLGTEYRQKMYDRKPHRHAWSIGEMSPEQDSGSESAPLLSSGSHTSIGPVMFPDSETSDLDSSPTGESSRYGSVGAASFNSVVTVIPKRLPPLIQDKTLVMSTPVIVPSPLPYEREGCYEIHNTDLLLRDGRFIPDQDCPVKDLTGNYYAGTFSMMQNANPLQYKDLIPKQSSLVTIFSIWNTILGSSLLTMPWGIAMAGLIPGIVLILAMGGLCLYTAYRLLQVHRYHGGDDRIEVTELSRIFLGPYAEYIAKIFSIMVLLGANIAYWIFMSNFLYNSVNFLYDNIAGLPIVPHTVNNSVPPEILCPKLDVHNVSNTEIVVDRSYDNLGPIWDLYRTVPIFLALLIFPLLNFNSTTFFTKFNSLGTASIIYLIVFVVVKSASWGINLDKTFWKTNWQLRSTFPALSGMLALSFFIHNIIITIMQSNHDQRKNGRDLTIAYILVTLTYVLVGVIFYISFPLAKSCIEDNLLNNFQKWDGLTVGARMVLLFQLFTVYPLIAYMLRIQLLSSIFKRSDYARGYVLIVNFLIVCICVLFAALMPHVGTIIRYTGAISGLIYVFTLPSLLHLSSMYKQGRSSILSTVFHLAIPIVGGSNLIGQFFVKDS
ncbi:sodium-coupled neutral amino acid transporter 9 [Cephus cinctus]|uniref:Sodium-coupled neutral amino acid transporter 9 n=1 Tax=Cephus cinctus TaxID=211228 RepID=A0AAJ7RJA4_CEPCN|nr:sodium-coupled neutral amino acid transporter 9 [Cephus cinctus]XP_024941982.1 sodium-coupled neutral amino acid transporter 9 [Cephus cinctus]